MTVIQLFKLGVKNAKRRMARTLLTMGMVAISTSLLVLATGWFNGIMDRMIEDSVDILSHINVADEVYVKKKIMQPLYANMGDVDAKAKAIKSQEGVVAVFGCIQSGATLTVGEEIGAASVPSPGPAGF